MQQCCLFKRQEVIVLSNIDELAYPSILEYHQETLDFFGERVR